MNKKRAALLIITLCYVTAVLFITLYRTESWQGIFLVPFREIRHMLRTKRYLHWGLQIGLNILMFVPFGVLLPAWHRRFESVGATVAAAMLCSVLIEAAQYVLVCGYSETDDVIHNTLGAWIGICLYRFVQRRCRAKQPAESGKP